jgi:hypothetical protein
MPTIDQLSQATAASDNDEFVVSQNGVARKIMRDQIIAGLQPSIATDSGTLLGRLSAGSGGPETIVVGSGLNLTANGLAVTTPFAVDPLPSTDNVADADVLPISQSGQLTKATRAQVVAGLQPAISLTSGSLLGRSSAGTGGPEGIAPGDGLMLSSGVLSATPIETLPAHAAPAATDMFLTRVSGVSQAITYQALMNGISGVPGVDVSSTIATPAGAMAHRTLSQRFADIINVLDFGAVGDGVTDDTIAIQTAINAAQQHGGHVFIPAGTYRVSSLTISGSFTLRGAGINATTLLSILGTAQPMLQIRLTGGTQYDRHRPVEIEQLTLQGNKNDAAGDNVTHGVDFQVATTNPRYDFVFFRNVQVNQFPGNGVNGISWQGAASFINCSMYNNKYYCVATNSCLDWTFSGCDFGEAGQHCVLLSGCSGFVFNGGGIYSSQGDGVLLYGASTNNTHNSFIGVSIDNNGKNGVTYNVNSNTNNSFVGCNFQQNSRSGSGAGSDIYVVSGAGVGLSVVNCRFDFTNPENSSSNTKYNIEFQDATPGSVVWASNLLNAGSAATANYTNNSGKLIWCGDSGFGIAPLSGNGGMQFNIAGGGAMTLQPFGLRLTNNGVVQQLFYDGSQPANLRQFSLSNGSQQFRIISLNDSWSAQYVNAAFDHNGSAWLGGSKQQASLAIAQTAATTTTSANWVQVAGAAGGGVPAISVQGSDTNISLSLGGKGNGALIVGTTSNAVGFFGSAGAMKPAITGAKGGNAALASLLAALVSLGLVSDNTTA